MLGVGRKIAIVGYGVKHPIISELANIHIHKGNIDYERSGCIKLDGLAGDFLPVKYFDFLIKRMKWYNKYGCYISKIKRKRRYRYIRNRRLD